MEQDLFNTEDLNTNELLEYSKFKKFVFKFTRLYLDKLREEMETEDETDNKYLLIRTFQEFYNYLNGGLRKS